jgi:hypothetical protein
VLALPVEQRVAPRPVKPGSLDLTGARTFLDSPELLQELENLIEINPLHLKKVFIF